MKLIIKKFGTLVKEIELIDGQEYILGRQEDCDIVLNSEALISRKHFKISQNENQIWRMESLSELGGLYRDGENVQEVELDSSSHFSFHEYIFQFVPPNHEETEEPLKSSFKPEPEVKSQESKEPEAMESPDEATKVLSVLPLSYSLSISMNTDPVQYVDLNEGTVWVVGRGEDCDIILENRYFTNKHFEIRKDKKQFTLKDLGSSNGTVVNDKKLTPQTNYVLKSQDIISVGDTEILFEARNRDFHKLSENLPSFSQEQESPTSMALPKVLLEEEPTYEANPEETNVSKKSFRKKLLLYSLCGLTITGLLIFKKIEKNKKAASVKVNKKEDEKMRLIETTYQFASVLMSQQKYTLCVEELHNLHKLTPYYKDSKQLLKQCQTAEVNQRRAEELKEQEEAMEAVRKKVNKIVSRCEKKLHEFHFLEELNECLGEAIQLDPANARISEMQNFLEHKAEMKRLEEERRLSFQKFLQDKMALYKRAKRLKDRGETLKAIPAYQKFLNASKNHASLKEAHDKAQKELEDMRNKYEGNLNRLYTSCETLIASSQMKKAYYECLKILNFKKGDQKALSLVAQAKNSLKDKLKPIYSKSTLAESLSHVEEAQELWQQIVKEDVETGYYYRKAKEKLSKYK